MPSARLLLAALLLAALLLAGCSTTDGAHSDTAGTPGVIPGERALAYEDEGVAVEAAPGERPPPYPLSLSRQFMEAVEADTRTLRGVPGPDYWQQEADYDLTARVYPDARRLEGSGTIRYTNHAPDTLYTLHLELAQNLHRAGAPRLEDAEVTGGVELARVTLDGTDLAEGDAAGGTARYVVNGTRLVVVPLAPVRPGDTIELGFDWAFTIPQQGAGARMGYSDDLVFLAYWYPIMAVYDDVEGWHSDPFLATSEFYYGFGDYDLTVEAPAGWIAGATGALQNADAVLRPEVARRLEQAHASDEPVMVLSPGERGTVDAPERLTWRFRADRVRDVAFSLTRDGFWEAARTPVGDADGDGATDYTHIHTYWRPDAPRWAEVTRYQQHAISFLSEYTGIPYPYPHMTAVEGGGIIGGGMEFPMMTLMGDYNARGDSALYWVTAHELAHMWVPMIVGTDERRYAWMDEGTTTFNESAARESFFPGAPDPDVVEQENYLVVARAGLEGEVMRWSNYHNTPVAYGTASYSKPATLLAALRAVLGEETFLRGYRAYLDAWSYRHPYPYDFFNAFEAAAGRDLDWFWHAWYFETWTMDQAITSVEPTDEGVRVTVRDLGLAPMPILFAVTLDDGRTLRREVPADVWLGGSEEVTVAIDLPAPAAGVVIDPDADLPDVDRSNNVWMR